MITYFGIHKIESLNIHVLQIFNFRFNVMFRKFYVRFNLIKMVNHKAVWALTLPLGVTYREPADKLSSKKEFRFLHPFKKEIFSRSF